MPVPPSDAKNMIRRRFLKVAGVGVVALPLGILARADTPPAKKKESVMQIKRVGSEPSAKGPADYFTESVRVNPLFDAAAPARVSDKN